MSLSIPTICAPSWLHRLTVSEPINPADPVTIIVRISLGDDKIDNHSRWLAKNPGYIARARIHSRGGIFRIAFEHAVNQLFLFCRAGAREQQASREPCGSCSARHPAERSVRRQK